MKSYIDEAKESVALVPGSWKPPTAGHWDMIMQYSKVADRVAVIISKPSDKYVRSNSDGKSVSPEDSKEIFEIYKKAYGVDNVDIIVSSHTSPVSAAFDYAEFELHDTTVIFGASKKDGDFKRWYNVSRYMGKNNPTINVIDPAETAVEPMKNSDVNISASDWRDHITDIGIYKDFIPDGINDEDIQTIYNILN